MLIWSKVGTTADQRGGISRFRWLRMKKFSEVFLGSRGKERVFSGEPATYLTVDDKGITENNQKLVFCNRRTLFF